MRSSFLTRPSALRAVFSAFRLVASVAWVLGIAACGKGAASDSSLGAVICPAPRDPDGGLSFQQSFGSGRASGSGVSATFCNAGIQLSGPASGGPSGLVLLAVDTTAPLASIEVRLPAGAVGMMMTGSIQVGTAGAPSAGIYKSSDAHVCGAMTLSYGELTVPAAECHGGAGATCPTGCTSSFICADAAAAPCCVPLAKTFVYQATAASSCTGGAQTGLGSWTLTLTYVAPFQGKGSQFGQLFYIAHGTLAATLQGTADTTDTASVSLSF